MNANIDNPEYLNEDIILTIKDEKFYLRIKHLELLVKGDDFDSAYNELVQKKNARLNIMKELNLHVPTSRLKENPNQLFTKKFFLNILIYTLIFLSLIIFTRKTFDGIIDARINQFRSAVELVPQYFNRHHAFKLTRLLEKVLHEEALKNPMEPKRQEKIIKDLRLIANRLKPFLDEIRPLFISEKLKPL